MTIDQISIFVENQPGRLAEVAELLAGVKVDLRALSIADTVDFGVLRAIVNEPLVALDALKNAGISAALTPVIAVGIDDAPGSLAHVIRVLADAGISVEYAYAFITRKENSAYVVLRVEDNDKAITVLSAQGFHTAGSQEIYDI